LFVWLAGVGVYLGDEAVRLFAAVPYASAHVVTPTKIELVLAYAALLAAVCLRGRRRVATAAALALAISADVLWWHAERFHPGELRVTFLSVGQGDSAVVEFPGGEVMVVDGGGQGGGSFDVGERVVAPFLWSRRIATVDRLVVTHPQYDHYGGLAHLVENFAPRELWSTGATSESLSYAALLEGARRGGVRRREMRAGERLRVGDADVQVEFPPLAAGDLGVNDSSLVLSLSYGGRRVLLTGDIEAPAEARLVRAVSDLRSAVVKVPHHGSASSSTPAFVGAVRPCVAVISAGYGNRYGFPSGRVLGRYAAHASRIMRTDLDGAVEIRIDSSGALRVRTAATGKWLTFDLDCRAQWALRLAQSIDTHGGAGISDKTETWRPIPRSSR
jgi:competence protein ComEC